MEVAVVIPTLDRLQSLRETIISLAQKNCEHKDFEIFVVVDGNRNLYEAMKSSEIVMGNANLLFNETRIGWGKSINHIMSISDYDAYFSASDDLQFFPDTLAEAVAAMERKFPDLDGVIGINQNLQKFCPAAFNLTGRKFINRFPGRKLYNPAYQHFCVDSELWHYAMHQGKFHFCKKAKVIHRRYNDPCHALARKTLQSDRHIWWAKKGKPHLYWPNMKTAGIRTSPPVIRKDPWE